MSWTSTPEIAEKDRIRREVFARYQAALDELDREPLVSASTEAKAAHVMQAAKKLARDTPSYCEPRYCFPTPMNSQKTWDGDRSHGSILK